MKTKKLRNKLPQPVERPSGEKQDSLPRRSRLCLVLHKRAGMRKKMQLGAYLSTSIGCWRSKEQIKWHKITSYKTKKKKKAQRGRSRNSWQKTAALYWLANARSKDPASSGGRAPGGHASS